MHMKDGHRMGEAILNAGSMVLQHSLDWDGQEECSEITVDEVHYTN